MQQPLVKSLGPLLGSPGALEETKRECCLSFVTFIPAASASCVTSSVAAERTEEICFQALHIKVSVFTVQVIALALCYSQRRTLTEVSFRAFRQPCNVV